MLMRNHVSAPILESRQADVRPQLLSFSMGSTGTFVRDATHSQNGIQITETWKPVGSQRAIWSSRYHFWTLTVTSEGGYLMVAQAESCLTSCSVEGAAPSQMTLLNYSLCAKISIW